MRVKLSRSEVQGEVHAPPSKSMTHRALIIAALAEGTSRVQSPLMSEDTEATMDVLRQLGVHLNVSADTVNIKGGTLSAPEGPLFCRESGTTMRLITSTCAHVKGDCRIEGNESLSRRPMSPLLDALNQLGVKTSSMDGLPPVTVHGKGMVPGGVAQITGDVSSQFISSLMIAAARANKPVEIHVTTPLESRPYVEMTMDAMRMYGVTVQRSRDYRNFKITPQSITPTEVKVEGDWSSAAFLIAAGALGGEATVRNLNHGSSQADKEIISILRKMNADITVEEDTVVSHKSSLKAVEHDLRDCPDLFPIVSALCTQAEGVSRLTGIERLRIKESDRVRSMTEGLEKMGAQIETTESHVEIKGGTLHGATINPYNDHRIAMSFAVLAQATEGETTINDAQCVSKSYPGFWEDLQELGSSIRRSKLV